jgi:HD-GYP domain-containing protein (c-di-GMP phosphodiesterase class II)
VYKNIFMEMRGFMRLVDLNQCPEGVYLAKPVLNSKNIVLLHAGVKLTRQTIQSLLRKGITFVYVETELTKDVELKESVSVETRNMVSNELKKVVHMLTEDSKIYRKVHSATNGKLLREFNLVYKRLVREITTCRGLLNLLTYLQDSGEKELLDHGINTSIYALAIARQLSIKEDDLYKLGVGAILHDIGRTKLPSHLQRKAPPYTKEEMEEIRKHPEIGYELIKKNPEISLLSAHCAYQHHEHVDGTGYPRGLKGEEIHIFGRIVAVADMFDSLMRNHHNHRALLPHEAMEVLNGYCYTRFDKRVIDAFRKAVSIYPVGITVTLSTGQKGVVIGNNDGIPQRPIVRVYTDNEGNALEQTYDINLIDRDHLSVMITECEAILDERIIGRVRVR